MYRLPTLAALTFLYMRLAPGLRAQAPDPAPAWLAADTAAKVVTLSLDVSAPPGAPSALINGYRSGGVQIVVPLNWTVTWHWQSSDSAAPHSLVLMAEREKLPTEGGRPALDNAMTRRVTGGLKAGQKDVTTFVADQAGWYWLLCGVPGHALKGEWVGLRVDPEARVPEVRSMKREGRRKKCPFSLLTSYFLLLPSPFSLSNFPISASNSATSRSCCAPVAGP
jgi:hypothetical protein